MFGLRTRRVVAWMAVLLVAVATMLVAVPVALVEQAAGTSAVLHVQGVRLPSGDRETPSGHVRDSLLIRGPPAPLPFV